MFHRYTKTATSAVIANATSTNGLAIITRFNAICARRTNSVIALNAPSAIVMPWMIVETPWKSRKPPATAATIGAISGKLSMNHWNTVLIASINGWTIGCAFCHASAIFPAVSESHCCTAGMF